MPSREEINNVIDLNASRKTGSSLGLSSNPMSQMKNNLSLAKQIELGKDWPYIPALLVAILKDVLDFVGIGSLPAIGTVVSIICSIFIFFMMLLAGSGGKRKMAKAILKGPMGRFLLLGAGTMAELLFGLNFLPIETAVVIGAYWMLLNERRAQKKAEQNNPQQEEE